MAPIVMLPYEAVTSRVVSASASAMVPTITAEPVVDEETVTESSTLDKVTLPVSRSAAAFVPPVIVNDVVSKLSRATDVRSSAFVVAEVVNVTLAASVMVTPALVLMPASTVTDAPATVSIDVAESASKIRR